MMALLEAATPECKPFRSDADTRQSTIKLSVAAGTIQVLFGFIWRSRAGAIEPRTMQHRGRYAMVFGGTSLGSGRDKQNDSSSSDTKAMVHSKDRDMGAALRSVYQRTIDERVPEDLLDLLGKLD